MNANGTIDILFFLLTEIKQNLLSCSLAIIGAKHLRGQVFEIKDTLQHYASPVGFKE
jgi:hypothetical protein